MRQLRGINTGRFGAALSGKQHKENQQRASPAAHDRSLSLSLSPGWKKSRITNATRTLQNLSSSTAARNCRGRKSTSFLHAGVGPKTGVPIGAMRKMRRRRDAGLSQLIEAR